ncbi:MAG: hypothetical protein AAGC60_23860 [Acidobacteriota bacterium]
MRGATVYALVVALATFVAYLLLLGPDALVQRFGGREAIAEHLGAFSFLGAAVVYFLCLRMTPRERPMRRLALGLLGVFFVVACGEELSWGQHALGFATPEPLRELNAQQEVNLHNLWLIDSYGADGEKKSGWQAVLLNSNRLFDLFMLGLFVVLPVLTRFGTTGRWLRRLDPPTPPARFAGVLGLNLVLTAVWELVVVDDMLHHLAVSEVREMSYGFLCLAAALWCRRESMEPGV